MKRILETILQTIGNTPLVKASRIFQSPTVNLLFKLEGNNPAGSVKDRAAYSMISKALEEGKITKESILIEATSGNTGIALAMVAKILDVNIQLVMPKNSSAERIQTMQAYGAKVILTSAEEGMIGSRDFVTEKLKDKKYVTLNQFANDNNWLAHYRTTCPEIWRDTDQQVTHFVSSMGTTGTIMRTSTFLKEKNNAIQIVGVHPDDNSQIPGIRKCPTEYLPKIYNPQKIDVIKEVSEKQAIAMTHHLAKEEAIFAGMSSGGCVHAALEVAKEISSGTVVAIICDRGDRYLSTGFFDDKL